MLVYVARKNIERYRALLKAAQDDERRRVLERLIAEEEARLAKLMAPRTDAEE